MFMIVLKKKKKCNFSNQYCFTPQIKAKVVVIKYYGCNMFNKLVLTLIQYFTYKFKLPYQVEYITSHLIISLTMSGLVFG